MVRTRRFHCHGLGSVPGGGTKIPEALRSQKNKTKQKTHWGIWQLNPNWSLLSVSPLGLQDLRLATGVLRVFVVVVFRNNYDHNLLCATACYKLFIIPSKPYNIVVR